MSSSAVASVTRPSTNVKISKMQSKPAHISTERKKARQVKLENEVGERIRCRSVTKLCEEESLAF
jgi:hypothetical protein